MKIPLPELIVLISLGCVFGIWIAWELKHAMQDPCDGKDDFTQP